MRGMAAAIPVVGMIADLHEYIHPFPSVCMYDMRTITYVYI